MEVNFTRLVAETETLFETSPIKVFLLPVFLSLACPKSFILVSSSWTQGIFKY